MQDLSWVRRVKLQQLRTVMVVAQSQSLSSAGRELGLSQPAISRIIHELETDLGIQLFIRTSRGTHPTSLGSMLAERAQTIFAQLEQANQEIHDVREGLAGHVKVGILPAGGAGILPKAVSRMHNRLPDVRVTLIEGTYEHLIPQLKRGELDFILGRLPGYLYREDLTVESFYREEIAFVVRPGHPVLRSLNASLADLQPWAWIMPLPGTTLRQMIESAFHDQSLDLPAVACESVSVVANRRLILETDYIGVFPAQVLVSDIQAGLLAKINVTPPISFGPVGISRLENTAFSLAAEALARELRAIALETKPEP